MAEKPRAEGAAPRSTPPTRGLGRGLRALLGGEPTEPAAAPTPIDAPAQGQVFACPLDRIRLNPHQPRERIDPQELVELVHSVRTSGILQPILVRPANGGYELIAGERRYRAALQAGLSTVPALLRAATDRESLELALVENLQRRDLNSIEEARGYEALVQEFHLTQEEVAERVGKERATVANVLRLLKLPSQVQDDLRAGRLQMGHARALLALSTEAEILSAREQILKAGASVRNTEALVRGRKKSAQPPAPSLDPNLRQLETDLRNALGTKVRIKDRNQKGTLEIEYFSWNDLQNIVKRILA
ncbi:MAG: ParB/RepB/Spo0J family partition protein [Nitrospirae bacterium]|nr:ParB/RepB/Spo0J family partition protein [Nitrospirota bacterium]